MFTILDYFASIDCETIVISNSPIENEDAKKKILHRGEKWLERENLGYDFGAWQYAIENRLIPQDTEYLFLSNDSVFGPLFDLDKVTHKMLSDSSLDFWGLTDSPEMGWHLQTYFLCFKKNVFTSAAFKDFFKQDFPSFTKAQVIENGEIGLTTSLTTAGFKGRAFFPYDKITSNKGFRFNNPTIEYADRLIKEFQFPFIKKEFILKNPKNIEIEGGVLAMIERETDYAISNVLEVLIDKCSGRQIKKDGPAIDVICHVYYVSSAYNFIIELSKLKTYNCRFLFNLSPQLYSAPYFVEILLQCFENSVIIKTSNIGKDIGGKLALIDLCMQLKDKSDYTILLHDKQSPHTSLGEKWRKKLFRIIEEDKIPMIIEMFEQDRQTGIIATSEFIINEYNQQTRKFECTSDQKLQELIQQYKFENINFDFVGGTMFWIRTVLLKDFFLQNDPLNIRSALEKGNVLDNEHGTNAHAWERMLSWIATARNYKIRGVHD